MCGGPEDTPAYMIESELDREFFERNRRQDDVAKILGVSRSYLSLMANGHARISTNMAARMQARLGWPALDFLIAQTSMEFERAYEKEAT